MIPSTVQMETTACIICQADEAELLFEREDCLTDQPGRFCVVRCRSCGHIYLNPRPAPKSIGFYYPEAYDPYKNPHPEDMRTPWGMWRVNHPLNQRCRLVTRYVFQGQILDLGCSTGQFLNQMKKYGTWRRIGIELSERAVAEARRRYDFEVIAGTLQTTEFPPHSFDVVTMWDVIEHLHDPRDDLEKIHCLLKPQGFLILSTPIRNSLGERLFGRYWVGYEIPRHLHIFSHQTLIRLLNQQGFELVTTKVIFGSNYALTDSMSFLLHALGVSKQFRDMVRYGLNHPVWQLATAPIFKLLDTLGLTTPITFVFVKPS